MTGTMPPRDTKQQPYCIIVCYLKPLHNLILIGRPQLSNIKRCDVSSKQKSLHKVHRKSPDKHVSLRINFTALTVKVFVIRSVIGYDMT